ncbi:hypothetical protein B9Z51_01770 [Limnohabitans sp. T6-5]|uniref:response regulator transcription factor n=1 Tax=Limnohabitans sp. T6-5 TaxID=1100724 RepID=UPI000D3807F5|nr:response regulator [Limnohabitans sp. T6-5]PUE11080.1 hypothetical protein B9Z51_01770 [Limnohabitans sp. T6-5]
MSAHIFVIEDDVELAQSLKVLLTSAGVDSVRLFGSPLEFIKSYPSLTETLQEPGCVLLDMRMPDMTGSELFALMQSQNFPWPVIFMTGHGDLSMAVNLMKAGAFDYVTKPFDPMGLFEKVKAATQLSRVRITDQLFKREQLLKLNSLTHHESLVFARILNNQTNREIAEALENSVRTIETHRANILKKMGKSSALELAQLHERFTLLGGVTPFPMAQQTPGP